MIKYKDLQPSQIKENPFTNIGAQDLRSIETNWEGLIRKEGALERGLKKLGPLSKVTSGQWRQYFVVISQGCVYVFHDEFSASPKIHFSLKNFGRLQRTYTTPNSFVILPISQEGKIYSFSCASDAQRLDWMRALYVSLLTVHKRPLPSTEQSHKKDEYTLLESEVAKPPPSLKDKIYEIDEDSSDDDDGYDKPDELEMLRKNKNKYSKDPTSFKSASLPPNPKHFFSKTRTKSEHSTSSTGKSPDIQELGNTLEEESHTFEDNGNDEEYSVDAASSTETMPKQKPNVAPKPTKTVSAMQDKESKPRYANTPPEISEKPKRNPNSSQDKIGKPASWKYTTMKSPDPNKQPETLKRDEVSKPLKSPGSKETDQTDYINMKGITESYVDQGLVMDPSSEYMFDGHKENAVRVLESQPVRTFLIRNSTEAGKKVLVVKLAFGLSSYKIEKQGSKLLIATEARFDTIQQLIDYYKKNKLPNIGVCLRRGFNAKDVDNTGDDGDYEPVAQPLKE